MKYKIAIIVITLPVVILISLSFMAHTQSVSEECIHATRQIEECVKSQRWEEARQILSELSAKWESKKSLLQLWILHQDTDDVTKYMKEVEIGLMLQEHSVIYLGTANLIESLSHLQHKDDLSLTNII